MKKIFFKTILLVALFLPTAFSYAQKSFFKDAKETAFKSLTQKRVIVPLKYRTILLDTTALLNFLDTVALEKNSVGHSNSPVIEIPMPDGTVSHFRIWKSTVMEPALEAKFPHLKTYTGQGTDDKAATIKIDWTELGFHAMILSSVNTSVFIDPYVQGTKTNYIAYFKSDLKNTQTFTEGPLSINSSDQARPASAGFEPTQLCIGQTLHTYRLAVACTHQYAIAATGLSNPTVAQTLAAIVTSINRVDGVYEQELDIHFNLVAKEDTIIFTTAAGDLFTANNNPGNLINQSQSVIDARIGNANYDIGHTFSTGGGGLTAATGIVCVTGQKASSETGLPNPVGDPFNIDYVSHEIGHEFGALHSFNSNQGFCDVDGQFFPTSNSEPGSGTTIMCYAEGPVANPGSLCGTDNLQVNSDPDFNALGFDQITQYITSGSGNACAVDSSTGNTAPVVNAGADHIIPKSTPFILTGSATDIDGDLLTYSWEQVDIGGPQCQWNKPLLNAPIFRSFPPVTTGTRYFPRLSDVINNTTTIGEIMSSYGRVLHFRLTVRDNHAGCGGICNDENAITVDSLSGPFVVTYPDTANTIWNTNDSVTVTWNTAGTQAAPVNCSTVMIQLSTDGGLTYPDTLIAATPNSGLAKIMVPDSLTTTARIRVMAVGNVFYDISNNNFIIQSAVPACPSSRLLFASDITGNMYQWQVDNGNGYTNINNDAVYSGTTTNILQLTSPPTSWYGYKYQCVVTAGTVSNSTAIVLKFGEQWSGGISTAWENPLNWSCGSVPDANTDVIINSAKTYFPIVNSNSAVRSLSINPGANITVNPTYKLAVTH